MGWVRRHHGRELAVLFVALTLLLLVSNAFAVEHVRRPAANGAATSAPSTTRSTSSRAGTSTTAPPPRSTTDASRPAASTSTTLAPPRTTLFDDEFDGTTLGGAWYPNRWFAAACARGATRDEAAFYTPSNVTVANGMLAVTARSTPFACDEGTWTGTRQYTSGWVQTGGARTDTGLVRAPGFSFTYGRIDIRFRTPAGPGLWPSMWLLPLDHYAGTPEIDILEQYNFHDWWSFRGHLGDGISVGADRAGPDTNAAFHTVSLDWEPGRLTWYIDDKAAYTYAGTAVPSSPMYVVINLAVGGPLVAPPNPATFPQSFLIDYVRVTR